MSLPSQNPPRHRAVRLYIYRRMAVHFVTGKRERFSNFFPGPAGAWTVPDRVEVAAVNQPDGAEQGGLQPARMDQDQDTAGLHAQRGSGLSSGKVAHARIARHAERIVKEIRGAAGRLRSRRAPR